MDYLKKNVEFLRKYYPNLLQIVNENKDLAEYSAVVRSETRNQEPNLALCINGQEVLLHSKYNAAAEAQKWAGTIASDVQETENVVLFGIGMGYFLEALLQFPQIKQIFVLEPSEEVFNELIRVRDISPLLSNNKIKLFAISTDELLIAHMARDIAASFIGKSLYVAAPPIYVRIFGELFNLLTVEVKNALVDEVGDYSTLHDFQETWLKNILFNIPSMLSSPSLQTLKDKWKGSKAIVVGSGPSLKEDIHYLNLLRKKCLIISAGSSVQALQYNGIQPHLVVSMDGGYPNLRVFENMDTDKVPLLFIPQIHHGILEIYKSKMSFASFNHDLVVPYLFSDTQVPMFHSTSTVTGTAIQAARFLGVNEILLMGQDLSYPKGQLYAEGVQHIYKATLNKQLRQTEEEGLTVINVNGGQNMTNPKMLSTLHDLELLIKLERLRGVKFINTSKEGAVIEGAEFKNMEDLLPEITSLPNLPFEVADLINPPSADNSMENRALIIAKLKYIQEQSITVEKKLDSLIETINEMNQNRIHNKKMKVNENLKRLNDLWNAVTKTEVFSIFFTFSRLHYIKVYERYVPAIVQEVDSFKKAELIEQHLGKLSLQISGFLPSLEELLIEATRRISNSNF